MDYSALKSIPENYDGSYDSTLETSPSDSAGLDMSDFKELMTIMMLSMTMGGGSSMGGMGGTGGASSMFGGGFSMSSIMMPIMMQMLDKLMTGQAYDQPEGTLIEEAKRIQINQFDAERQVGGDGKNANCGPTSLVMALHALGLRVAGEDDFMSPGQIVDLARRGMVTDPSKDGVDSEGRRVDAEHDAYTNFDDLMRGAKAAGASASRIDSDADSIKKALMRGDKVIVSGTFSGKQPLPWTGDRGHDNESAPGGATKHIIAVTGVDPVSGQFIINDPARRTPVLVSGDQLESFMRGNPGALSVSKY